MRSIWMFIQRIVSSRSGNVPVKEDVTIVRSSGFDEQGQLPMEWPIRLEGIRSLTQREWDVLRVVCKYKTLPLTEIWAKNEIVKDDGTPVKPNTAGNILQTIYRKLSIDDGRASLRTLERDYCPLVEQLQKYLRIDDVKEIDIGNLFPDEAQENDGIVSGEAERDRQAEQDKLWQLLRANGRIASSFVGVAILILTILLVWPEKKVVSGSTCDSLEITSAVFPQLKDIPSQHPFYDHEHATVFECTTASERVHTSPLALQLTFKTPENIEQYGYFGIGTLGGFDASGFSQLCFHTYVEKPRQRFWVNLKDTNTNTGNDARFSVFVHATNSWEETCILLEEYETQGIDLSQLENVNISFDNRTGAAIVWVDSFEFR